MKTPTPLYVVPDIHGHADQLDRVLDQIDADGGKDAPVIFLGDYVDRGPDSRRVIERLITGAAQGRDWTFLRGNHDQMMLEALGLLRDAPDTERDGIHWLSYPSGAVEALASYGARSDDPTHVLLAAIPDAHLAFLDATRLIVDTPDLILSHAGIRPGLPLDQQTPEDLMWMREPFLSDPRDHGRLVVHGHSPVTFPEHHGNRIALDGGAGWGRPLRAAVFEGRACWLLSEGGRVPLVP